MAALDRTTPISAMLAAGAVSHLAPLLAGVRGGVINLALIHRKSPVAVYGASPAPRPMVMLVGDDLDGSHGPEGFDHSDLIAAAKAASHVVVYSGAADPELYQLFVAAATLGRLVLVVETRTAHHEKWKRFLGRYAPRAALLDISPETAEGRA